MEAAESLPQVDATDLVSYLVLQTDFELLGKWYTRPYKPENKARIEELLSSSPKADSSEKFCYCRGNEEGEMIGCDNTECTIEWFHTKCLRINNVLRGKWYCPECRKLPKYSRRVLSVIQ